MNSTHLLQREGGSVVKQGDISSLFSFKLADEYRNPITGLNGQEATIRLINVGKISLELTKVVEHDMVSFTIEQVIAVGTYSVEVHVGGYVFPSDNKVWLKVEKSSTDYEVKELVPMDLLALTSKIQSFEQLLAGYKLYDDRELKDSVAQIKTLSEGLASRLDGIKGYDDQALRDEIRGISERIDALVDKDTVYDDTELKNAIADILLRLGRLANYDDTAIKAEIKELRQELKSLVIPAAYNDQDLKRQMATLDSRLDALEQRADKDTVYNDEVLVQAISEIRQQLATLSQSGKVEVQQYDDTALKNALAQVNQRLDDLVIPQAYDDSDIKQRLTALESKPEVDLSAYRKKADPIELAPEQVQQLKGPKGDPGQNGQPGQDGMKGEDGEAGQDGKSAYQSWLDLGNQGSEQEFIASLKGERGTDGQRGEAGQDGQKGADGVSPVIADVQLEMIGTFEEPSAELSGSQDNLTVKLKVPRSPAGPEGQPGVDGAPGKDGKTPVLKVGQVTKSPSTEDPSVSMREVAGETLLDFSIPESKTVISDLSISSAINPNLFLTPDGIDMRKGVGHGSRVKFEDATYFKTTSPTNDYISVPALNTITGTLEAGSTYTVSFLTDDKVGAINFYFNSTSNYRPTTITELGNGQRIFSTTWQSPNSAPLTVHMQVGANEGTILKAKLEKGNVSTLIPESDRYAMQIVTMAHQMRELKAGLELVKTTLEQTGSVVRAEYQSHYLSLEEMKAVGFVPANNTFGTVKFKKPFSKRPHVNVTLDIQGTAVRIPYIGNVTETSFDIGSNYAPDIKGVWYEGWVE